MRLMPLVPRLVAVGTMAVTMLAFASAGKSAPAGGGVQPLTAQPDLVSAEITNKPNLDDPGPALIRACFDSGVSAAAPAGFSIRGVGVAASVVAPIATLVANTDCVELEFPASTNVGTFSVLEVAQSAVTSTAEDALSSPEGAAALVGSDIEPGAGKTAGPNLVSTSHQAVDGGTRVTYTFDAVIDQNATGQAGDFGYHLSDGRPAGGGRVFSQNGKAVTIEFPAAIAGDVRFFVEETAVRTAFSGQPNATSVTGLGTAPAPATGAPDLISAVRFGDQSTRTFDLTFDQDIDVGPTPAFCNAHTSTGLYTGTVSQLISTRVVRVTFGTLPDDTTDEVVRITDRRGCALDAATPNVLSSVGQANVISKDHAPGFTSGPDLTGCTFVSGDSSDIDFIFDESVEQGPVTPNAAAIAVYDDAGTRTPAMSTVKIDDTRVAARFPPGARDTAHTCAVAPGAVTSNESPPNEFNPRGAVKVNTTGTPEPTSPAMTSPASPATGTPPQAPTGEADQNGRTLVRGRVTRIKTPGRRVKATIAARGACKANRRVVVSRRGGGKLGKDRSSFKGTFNVRLRRNVRGRVVIKIRAKRTATLRCRPLRKTIRNR